MLGTRLALGWNWAGVALLVIALTSWLLLLRPVLSHWVTPTTGVSLLLTVSTQSLAVLPATLAASERADWLLYAALAPFLLGLVFYVFVISRFDFRQIGVRRGDQWGAKTAAALRPTALVNGIPARHVRRLQLRRGRARDRDRDYRLRARLGLGQRRRVGRGVRRCLFEI